MNKQKHDFQWYKVTIAKQFNPTPGFHTFYQHLHKKWSVLTGETQACHDINSQQLQILTSGDTDRNIFPLESFYGLPGQGSCSILNEERANQCGIAEWQIR